MRILLCLLACAFSLSGKAILNGHPLLQPDTIAQGKLCYKWLNHRPLTKVVAALNPMKGDDLHLSRILALGVDVARLNMSHIPLVDAIPAIYKVDRAAKIAGRTVGILYDLPGPKLRIGTLPTEDPSALNGVERIELFRGDKVTQAAFLDPKALRLPLPAWIFHELTPVSGTLLKPGHRVLFDDGKLQTEVVTATRDLVVLKVSKASDSVAIRSRLGVEFPDCDLRIPAVQHADRRAILAGLITGKVHKIALSFVRSADDIHEGRAVVKAYLAILKRVQTGPGPEDRDPFWNEIRALIPEGPARNSPREWLKAHLKDVVLVAPEIDAKIERREAVLNIDSILDAADGVMIARGDLIMAVGSHNLLMAETKIVRSAQERRKPVIVATGLLSGANHGVVPHSSAIDVGAVALLFADAAQLSNESVIGDPFEAIPQLCLHLVGGELAAFDSPLTPHFALTAPTAQYTNDPAKVMLPPVTSAGHYVFTQNAHLAGLLSFRRAIRVVLVNAPPAPSDYVKLITQAGYSVTAVEPR